MCTHRVRLAAPADVNGELIAWLRQAYDTAGGYAALDRDGCLVCVQDDLTGSWRVMHSLSYTAARARCSLYLPDHLIKCGGDSGATDEGNTGGDHFSS